MPRVGDLERFRVAVRHPDRKHASHAWAQIGGTFDTAEDAQEELVDAAASADLEEIRRVDASIPPEERVRKRDADGLAELLDLGYEAKIEKLVVTEVAKDDGGNDVATAHAWRDA